MIVKYLRNAKTLFFVTLFIIFYPISVISQEKIFHFFDLSKERNLENIIAVLHKDGFEENKKHKTGDFPSLCYTKSSEGLYARFNCNYTPKTKLVASYWYRIYGGNSSLILSQLKHQFGSPNSVSEYYVPYSYEWHSQTVDIKLTIGQDIYYSYKDKTINEKLMKEIRSGFSSDELFVILYLFGLCLVGGLFAYALYRKNKKQRIQEESLKIKRKEEQEKIKSLNEAFKRDLENKYGKPTRIITLQNNNNDVTKLYNSIYVFQYSKKIVIGKNEYNFEEILNCNIHDKNAGNTTISQTTRTKTGSLLGRAAVGALTFGAAGAVVGAVTAKKESTNTITPTHSESYIVKIGLKSVEQPVLTLEFGSDKTKAEEVYNLMQAIIAMK